MQQWLVTLIQQAVQSIVPALPDAAASGQREVEKLRDPYIDKHAYWFRRGGDAELDADDHRTYDQMTAEEKLRLAEMQIAGKVGSYTNAKPKHRRPWTGAGWARLQMYSPHFGDESTWLEHIRDENLRLLAEWNLAARNPTPPQSRLDQFLRGPKPSQAESDPAAPA